MKKLLMFICALMLVCSIGGVAGAIPYSDTYDASHYRMDPWGANSSVTWTFDITDDGFNPNTQDVTSASVSLNFSDDGGLIGLNSLHSMLGPIDFFGRLIVEMSVLRLRR
jgi:hypothetical protein